MMQKDQQNEVEEHPEAGERGLLQRGLERGRLLDLAFSVLLRSKACMLTEEADKERGAGEVHLIRNLCH